MDRASGAEGYGLRVFLFSVTSALCYFLPTAGGRSAHGFLSSSLAWESNCHGLDSGILGRASVWSGALEDRFPQLSQLDGFHLFEV